MNTNIYNLISQLNNKSFEKTNLIKIDHVNVGILLLLEELEVKGYIKTKYNPYSKQILIYDNKIRHIKVKSKPSRRVFLNKTNPYTTTTNVIPYKLSFGDFIVNFNNKHKQQELLLYVE